MKFRKNAKALSPVIASVILIAVTVAVALAVAVYMINLTNQFQGVEQIAVTRLTWTPNNQFAMIVNNTGTKDLTINHLEWNYALITTVTPTLPATLKTGNSLTLTATLSSNYVNGTGYDITVATSSSYKFTDHYIGGTNIGS